jgi:nucleotide-binding universal stress UspA family protein
VPTTLVGPKVLANMVTGTKAVKSCAETRAIRRILVPLDASPLAESALQPARELAESLGAELLLVQVVRWAASVATFGVPDIDIAEIDRQLTEAAEEYLARVKEQLDTRQPVETRVLHGPPADILIDLTAAQHIDLVVMTSHARSNLGRAVIGSVADRMLRGQAPVTLIRPEGVTAIRRAPRGRYCHSCGRASPFIEVLPTDRCLRCGQHLRACANCVYHDGIACLLQRPDMQHAYPGQDCHYFQFRETAAPKQTAHSTRAEAVTKK